MRVCCLAAMDGVLESAVVLCSCKLACSLLFLPSLAASYSPVSFCCCCLLIFTDFLVTGEDMTRCPAHSRPLIKCLPGQLSQFLLPKL